jgi:hypothetical protein
LGVILFGEAKTGGDLSKVTGSESLLDGPWAAVACVQQRPAPNFCFI